jgi:hypothetical protein
MRKWLAWTIALTCAFDAAPVAAQSFEVLGTRAAGMGGAFVAVADDASAVYWNPAGLVFGRSLFSVVVDGKLGEAEPDTSPRAGRQTAGIVAMTTPPIGLSYYRLDARTLGVPAGSATPLQRLTTHHTGLTIVQSVTSAFALASTFKLVRGYAAADVVPSGNREDLLDQAGDLGDQATNKFDVDVGFMASLGKVRAGVTLRNLTEPDFPLPNGDEIELKRQTRAGIAYVGVQGLIVSGDIDLERSRGSLGEVRNLAAGAEAQLFPRVFVRGGFRFNTLSDQPGGEAFVYSVGGGYVVFRKVVIDGQMTRGSEAGDRGWGVSARLMY